MARDSGADVTERTVVVVHGIGEQASGATATHWIEGFIELLSAQGRRIDVVENRLREEDGSAVVLVGDRDTVAQPAVTDPVLRLRVVEARWADSFVAPGPLAVLKWLLWLAPNIGFIQSLLSRRGHETLDRIAEDAGRATRPVRVARGLASLVAFLLPVVYLGVGLVALAVAGPVVLVLVAVVLVASIIPVNWIRNAATRVLSVVSHQIGDVTVFLARPVDRGAMESQVERIVRREVARTGRDGVHVLAHSQGAALVQAVLRRMPHELRPSKLTTVGGAHGRLHDMRLVTPPRWTIGPIALCSAAWLMAVPLFGLWGRQGLLIPAGATVLVLAGLAFAAWLTVRRAPDLDLGPIDDVKWLDLWAPFDPVPNGRPATEPGGRYLAQTVPGRMTFLLDHVYYAKDWTETVPRVLFHITGRFGSPRGVRPRKSLGDPDGVGPNWTPWSRQDWVSFVCRGAIVLYAGVLALANLQVSGQIGSWLTSTWLRNAVTSIAEGWRAWLTWLPGSEPVPVESVVVGVERGIGVIAVVVLGILAANVVKALYWSAVGSEARRWAESGDRWSQSRWWTVGGAVVTVWAGLAVGLTVLVAR